MNLKLLIFLLPIAYVIRTLIFIYGSYLSRSKAKKLAKNSNQPFVSVIVPSRNEEDNIARCLKALSNSDYPQDYFEIIAVNDRSEDRTKEIIHSFESKINNLIVLDIANPSEKEVPGKPGAIQKALDIAKGEFILMTDADCKAHKSWIRKMVEAHTQNNADLVASFTLVKGKSPFDRMQEVEWMYSHTIASAGVELKLPLGCYGNNMSISKKLFLELGGYKKIAFSVTEDLALLQAAHRAGANLSYLTNLNSTVKTYPCPDLKDYFKQKKRWAIGGIALGWKAFVFMITTLSFWTAIIVSIISSDYVSLGALILLRLIFDSLLILPNLINLKETKLIKWMPLSVIFLMFVELIVPFLVLDKRVEWKGQVFR